MSHITQGPGVVESCPAPMTRNALIALRNSGGLSVQCHYVVTNYNRGRVGPAVILLHAVDERTLSMEAEVSTGFDSVAWRGLYDVDTNRITALTDNRNNRVSGTVGAEVDAFPWGSARANGCIVDGATLLADAAPACNLDRVEVRGNARLDVRGATGGFYRSKFEADSQALFRDAVNPYVLAFRAHNARVYAERSTNARLERSAVVEYGYTNFRDRTGSRLYMSTVEDYGETIDFAGNLQIFYSNISARGSVRNQAGAGRLLVYGVTFHGANSRLWNYNTADARSYYDTGANGGRLYFRGGALIRSFYSRVSGLGQIDMTSPTAYAYGVEVVGQLSRLLSTGGNHFRMFITAGADLRTAFSTRSVVCLGRFVKTLTAVNTNKGKDYFNDNLV